MGVETYSDPSNIFFRGSGPPTAMIYASVVENVISWVGGRNSAVIRLTGDAVVPSATEAEAAAALG